MPQTFCFATANDWRELFEGIDTSGLAILKISDPAPLGPEFLPHGFGFPESPNAGSDQFVLLDREEAEDVFRAGFHPHPCFLTTCVLLSPGGAHDPACILLGSVFWKEDDPDAKGREWYDRIVAAMRKRWARAPYPPRVLGDRGGNLRIGTEAMKLARLGLRLVMTYIGEPRYDLRLPEK